MEINQKLRLIILLLSMTSVCLPAKVFSGSVTTADLIARSMSSDCLEWKISGICIWLKCSIFGCYVTTTPRISHRLPDFAVVAYPQTTESPWIETRSMFNSNSSSGGLLLSGGSIIGVGNELMQPDSLAFNEVDVIGNPAAQLSNFSRFLCRSESKALFPYFISLQDASAWRSGLPDGLRNESTTPGKREIGRWPHFTWGSVYPRTGFVFQNHSGKAAAVSCQRGVDVVLRDGSGHISTPHSTVKEKSVSRGDTESKSENQCNLSGGRWEFYPKLDNVGRCIPQTWHQWLPSSNEKTDRWQMILPVYSEKCETFGQSEKWNHESIAQDANYIWNYWAKYKCCVKGGGFLLAHFDF